MTRAGAIGAAVEGHKLSLKTRQFYPIRPKKKKAAEGEEAAQKVYSFHLGMNSTATISHAYETPATQKKYQTSMHDVGDEVFGATVTGWAKKPLGEPNIEKGSASHSASFLKISGGCYATVVIAAREILESAEASARETKKLESQSKPTEAE